VAAKFPTFSPTSLAASLFCSWRCWSSASPSYCSWRCSTGSTTEGTKFRFMPLADLRMLLGEQLAPASSIAAGTDKPWRYFRHGSNSVNYISWSVNDLNSNNVHSPTEEHMRCLGPFFVQVSRVWMCTEKQSQLEWALPHPCWEHYFWSLSNLLSFWAALRSLRNA